MQKFKPDDKIALKIYENRPHAYKEEKSNTLKPS